MVTGGLGIAFIFDWQASEFTHHHQKSYFFHKIFQQKKNDKEKKKHNATQRKTLSILMAFRLGCYCWCRCCFICCFLHLYAEWRLTGQIHCDKVNISTTMKISCAHARTHIHVIKSIYKTSTAAIKIVAHRCRNNEYLIVINEYQSSVWYAIGKNRCLRAYMTGDL